MLTFIKLGGSLITDKRAEASFHGDLMARLAREITQAASDDAALQLVIGHGSGSFGHFAARRYGTVQGVHTPQDWRGFAEVSIAAAELNYLVGKALADAGLPIWRIQPSASARCNDGELIEMALHPMQAAIAHGLVPLIYGDVALDEVRGGTIISTETIMVYLAAHLPVQQIILIGEVEGVYDNAGAVIPSITPQNIGEYADVLGSSGGVDVTGGMLTKVQAMLDLVSARRSLTIRIMDGRQPGLLLRTLKGEAQPGTLIQVV
jgi:isopentenyl phosphate kinase